MPATKRKIRRIIADNNPHNDCFTKYLKIPPDTLPGDKKFARERGHRQAFERKQIDVINPREEIVCNFIGL